MLKTQNLLRTTNPENWSLIVQILLKISFLKGQKETRFEKTSFELTVTEILKIKLQYFKIQMPIKTKLKSRLKTISVVYLLQARLFSENFSRTSTIHSGIFGGRALWADIRELKVSVKENEVPTEKKF